MYLIGASEDECKGQIEHNRGVDFPSNLTWGMRQAPVRRTAEQQITNSAGLDRNREVCSHHHAARMQHKTITLFGHRQP